MRKSSKRFESGRFDSIPLLHPRRLIHFRHPRGTRTNVLLFRNNNPRYLAHHRMHPQKNLVINPCMPQWTPTLSSDVNYVSNNATDHVQWLRGPPPRGKIRTSILIPTCIRHNSIISSSNNNQHPVDTLHRANDKKRNIRRIGRSHRNKARANRL